MSKAQQLVQKLNVPQEMQNDPHQIVDFLVQSGKVNQDAVNRAVQIAQQLGIKV
jgi:hypothetical protein